MSDEHAELRRRIAEALQATAIELDARVVQDVRVGEGVAGSRLDFVFVDVYGCLVIRVEPWPGARLQGTSEGSAWAAATPSGSVSFPNPFLALKGQIASLIVHVGLALPDPGVRHVSDLVVTDAAETDRLILDDAHRFKMVGVDGLVDALRARHDFAINAGVYTQEQVQAVADAVAAFAPSVPVEPASSEAGNHQLVEMQDAVPVVAPVAVMQPAAVEPEPAPASGYSAQPAEVESQPAYAGTPWKAPSADEPPSPYRHDGWTDMPAVAPPRAIAFSGYPSDPVERKRKIRVDASLITAVFFAGIAVWLFYYGGLPKIVNATTGMVGGIQTRYSDQVTAAHEAAGGEPSAAGALTAIKDRDAKIYASLIDRDTPQVTKRGEYLVYSWKYGAPALPSGTEKTVTVIYDANGLLRGVDANP